jgi:hypothetical protein
MIEFNSKTQQDFLNREWVQKLLDAGVDMSDAKYKIIKDAQSDKFYIVQKDENYIYYKDILSTYTVSELLYKLHEWIYPVIDGHEYSGGLRFLKDAPFYIFYYSLYYNENKNNPGIPVGVKAEIEDYIYAEFEYPIESLAALLIQCHTKDIGMVRKDTGNISDK